MQRPIIKPIIFNQPDEEIREENKTNTNILEKKPDSYLCEELKDVCIFNKPETPKPETWDIEITALETYFTGKELPSYPVKLDQVTTITDLPKFIQGHLATIKSNNGNRTFLPYLHRLQALKVIIESKDFTP